MNAENLRAHAKVLRGLVSVDRLRLLNPEIAALLQGAQALETLAEAPPPVETLRAAGGAE